MEALGDALAIFVRLEVLGVIVLAAAVGIFVGAIPGLTATMAVALLVPLTWVLDDVSALAAIVTLEACAIFAGDLPTALVRIPGTPSSAAYVDDAYALTRQGRQHEALGTCLLFSVFGGLFGAAVLIVAAPWVAEVAFRFSTVEYFWLTLLGLSCAVVVSRGSALKGAVALLIGLLLSTVGLSRVHSQPRFTFGFDELMAGISFIPAMIGLFGISEVLRNVIRPRAELGAVHRPAAAKPAESAAAEGATEPPAPSDRVFRAPLRRLRYRLPAAVRSSSIGSFVGMLPGAGADIAAWISYAVSKRFSRRPREYGAGSAEGLGDATAANNSALAGAWMPALVLGIPGDSVTAIVIGVLMMKNVMPGPKILENQPELVYGIYSTFILANIALIPLGYLAIRAAGRLVTMPRRILLPVVVIFSIVGSYAITGSDFDIWVMLAMGLLGFVLEAWGVPLGPVVLGIILGGRLEEHFIQSLTKYGTLGGFFERPWAKALGAITILVWTAPVALALWRGFPRRRPRGD